MRVHVVYAHPLADSFNAALHDYVVTALRGGGHEVDDCDLYAEGFQPALTAAERAAYHTVGGNLAGIEGYVERLRAAQALVICAPTWWYGMPAMLKGYFDRVWVPGVAFDLLPRGGAIRPGLTNITSYAVVTTTGSPWWFMRLYMRDPGKRVLMRGLRRLFAPNVRMRYLCHYGIDTSTPRTRDDFLQRVRATFEAF
jgi:putative NADPH-quinone reductase